MYLYSLSLYKRNVYYMFRNAAEGLHECYIRRIKNARVCCPKKRWHINTSIYVYDVEYWRI